MHRAGGMLHQRSLDSKRRNHARITWTRWPSAAFPLRLPSARFAAYTCQSCLDRWCGPSTILLVNAPELVSPANRVLHSYLFRVGCIVGVDFLLIQLAVVVQIGFVKDRFRNALLECLLLGQRFLAGLDSRRAGSIAGALCLIGRLIICGINASNRESRDSS